MLDKHIQTKSTAPSLGHFFVLCYPMHPAELAGQKIVGLKNSQTTMATSNKKKKANSSFTYHSFDNTSVPLRKIPLLEFIFSALSEK